MAMIAAARTGMAQPMASPAPSPEVLLSTQFRSPLTYAAAMARLDDYYDQEIGRKSAAAIPPIAPSRNFDLWHDMWVSFEPVDGGMQVTIKRPADGVNSRLVKGWMLNLAGKLDVSALLAFREEPALHSVDGDLYVSKLDLWRSLQADTAFHALPTWQHSGILVSASPMASVVLAPAGLHGVRHVTVQAETSAAAKLLWNRIQQAALQPGIYAAFSEDVEIEEELRNAVQGQTDTLGVTAAQAIYIPQMDPKLIEAKLRADPEMNRRAASAHGQYTIRFRTDKPYRKIVVTWTELTGYSRTDGKHTGERPLGASTMAIVKMPAASAAPLAARTKLETLKPGAYRIHMEGEGSTGELQKIYERTYWFDGKIFEEL
jgi:hypothetical protein